MNNRVIEIFKKITTIPRETAHEEQMVEYLENFAKSNNLDYIKDDFNNIIIKKKTCDKPAVILQAHTDMVCVKEDSSPIDFSKDAINVYEENGYLTARGTSLGADNGIGVALILDILECDIPVNIEAVFTSEEETTMRGAINLDTSNLTGKYLINLDGFNDNTIIIESSSFFDILFSTPFSFISCNQKNAYEIKLKGLLGGHSGEDIDANRGNANKLLAELLMKLNDLSLISFIGGTGFNVIPSTATAIIATDLDRSALEEICLTFQLNNKQNYPNLDLHIEETSLTNGLTEEDTTRYLDSIISFPHGVFDKHDNHVTTSVNLGVVNLQEQIFKVGMRSSRKEEEQELLNKLEQHTQKYKYAMKILGSQPGFRSNPECHLIKVLQETSNKEYYLKDPEVQIVHFTVEAGFFQEKIKDLELAIISPNLYDLHSVNERVEIASIYETDAWLRRFLENY